MKKILLFVLAAMLLSSCGEETVVKEDLPTYEIINKNSDDSGSVAIELEISTSDMEEVKKVVQYIVDERYEETGLDQGRYEIESMRFKVYEKETGDFLSNATVALSNKGKAQTGLELNKVEYK